LVATAVSALTLTAACGHWSWVPPSASPRTTIPNGTIREDLFVSAALGTAKHLVVYLPPSYAHDTSQRYPVAYYLHGLSGAESDWVAKGGIDAAADSLFNRGTPEMIIVMPDGDDGWYTTWANQLDYGACADTLHAEAPLSYCVRHQRYDDYIARDVVRYVDSHYRTQADRAHRGIGGLSMGGYGALSVALHFPDVFSAAASHSGVVSPMYVGPHPFVAPPQYATEADILRPAAAVYWSRYKMYWGTDLERWRTADPARAAALLQRHGGRLPSIFIDCGTEDALLDQNRALHDELTRLHVRHDYAEWPGAHTWRYWSTHVRESLAWMGTKIG
jgi:S-formylglutathione hydrolase FrmB